jgi:hypothetical protein
MRLSILNSSSAARSSSYCSRRVGCRRSTHVVCDVVLVGCRLASSVRGRMNKRDNWRLYRWLTASFCHGIASRNSGGRCELDRWRYGMGQPLPSSLRCMRRNGIGDDTSSAYEALPLAWLSEFGMIFHSSPRFITAYARCRLSPPSSHTATSPSSPISVARARARVRARVRARSRACAYARRALSGSGIPGGGRAFLIARTRGLLHFPA